VTEIQKMMVEEKRTAAISLPVVEIPATKPNDAVTLFYSGDGGWRDLDRAVAGQMADLGYPVVGVDSLRYFWSRKTPEEAANDLAVAMTYYRKAWGAKIFVLAGYSFGADILPAVYNRLPDPDRENVALLVLLALSRTADFEIHVSGWLGKNSSGVPILPELDRIPGNKILCITGRQEMADSVCSVLSTPDVKLMELPGGHHFDQDYPNLAKRIIDMYRQIGLKVSN
jgi:type IV secretory pathway VirJ component